jgi:hypothetical protein
MEPELAVAASDCFLCGVLFAFFQAVDRTGPVKSDRCLHLLHGTRGVSPYSEAYAAMGRDMCRSGSASYYSDRNGLFSFVLIIRFFGGWPYGAVGR